jgi:hypothetical protein
VKTAGEAWEEVRLALSRGEHGYRKGCYEWSSPLVERADRMVCKTACAQLSQIHVEMGPIVREGRVTGPATSTSNSTGPHLLLTLKKQGTTAGGERAYPYDVVGPMSFLQRR